MNRENVTPRPVAFSSYNIHDEVAVFNDISLNAIKKCIPSKTYSFRKFSR